MMRIEVNGKPMQMCSGGTVSDLLDILQLERPGLAVEHNMELVPLSCHAETVLAAGDRLEIVHFVGGG